MIKKFSIFIFFILIGLPALSAEEKNQTTAVNKNVEVFQFLPAVNNEIYDYYAKIIPQTIVRSLRESAKYNVILSEKKLELLDPSVTKKIIQDYYNNLRSISSIGQGSDYEKNGFNYSVTGTCEIIEDKTVLVNGQNEKLLYIKIQVTNLLNDRSSYFETKSKEAGAILNDTIDTLKNEIGTRITQFEIENMKMLARARVKPSPFIPLYNFLHRITFGFDVGEFFILGKWADLYNWTPYIRPYILIDINGYLGVSLNFTYFSTDNQDMDKVNSSIYSVYNIGASLHYFFRFAKYFDISVEAGTGMAVSNLSFDYPNGGDPFTDKLGEKDSIDASMDTGASIGFHISSVVLRIGSSYKMIFYSDEFLMGVTVYGSVGYNF